MTAPESLAMLCATAGSVGLLHTLLGPDHYVPFVAMSRAGRWTLARTLAVTWLCGAAHVLSSVVLGTVGLAIGLAVLNVENIEAARGAIAGWMLLAFGMIYLAWGVRQAVRNRPHTHLHVHADGMVHTHVHTHHDEHLHVHADRRPHSQAPAASDNARPARVAPWALFTIFLFGPCEPLIPFLMYPAATGSVWGVVAVTIVFGLTTLATMTLVVTAAFYGLNRFSLGRFHRFGHAAAGAVVTACGVAVQLGA